MFRWHKEHLEFLLVHPGGPFFRNKDDGAWTIPKGLVSESEDLLETACREFQEETGIVPEKPFYPLEAIKQKGGKTVHAWGFECPSKFSQWNPETDLVSNTFEIEWPPKSGMKQLFPEVDRACWFNFEQATVKLNPAQVSFIVAARKKQAP